MSFSDYLQKRASLARKAEAQILIFDQFEEILTLDPLNETARQEFFQQVGVALRDRTCWALFSMREDYLAGLDPYVRAIPTRFSNTFRLDLLTPENAREAIQGPAASRGVTFCDDAADKLVNDLRQAMVQDIDGDWEQRAGRHIEPVHLQLVCYRVWAHHPRGAPRITIDEVGGGTSEMAEGPVGSALSEYYAERVWDVALAKGVKEMILRQWIERQLITPAGIRSQVMEDKEETAGLRNEVVHALEAAYLIRREKRRGAAFIELAHDRLIEPIRVSNERWFREHRSLLQRQAALWASHRKDESLCLRNHSFVEAERWAQTHGDEMTPVDREFLEACRRLCDAQKSAAEKARAASLQKRMIALSILAFVTVSLSIWALWERGKANKETARANQEAMIASSRSLAAQASGHLDQKLDLAQVLAVEAERRSPTPEARGALLTAAFHNPRLQYILHGHKAGLAALTFSPDGKWLAAGDWNKTVLLWNLANRSFQDLAPPFADVVRSVTFSPDGKHLAASSKDGKLALWAVPDLSKSPAPFPAPLMLETPRVASAGEISRDAAGNVLDRDIWALAFSPDSRWLASSGSNGQVVIWDVSARAVSTVVPTLNETRVRALAFGSINGETVLVVGNEEPTGRLKPRVPTSENERFVSFWSFREADRSIKLRERPELWPAPPKDILSLALSRDGRTIAVGGKNKTITLRNLLTQSEQRLDGGGKRITAVVFNQSSTKLLSSSDDGTVLLWDVATGQTIGAPFVGHIGQVFALATHPLEDRVVSGAMDQKISSWDISATLQSESPPEPMSGQSALALSPDCRWKAVGFKDGTVALLPAFPPANSRVEILPRVRHPATSPSASPAEVEIANLSFSRNSRYLVSISRNGAIGIIDTTTSAAGKIFRERPAGESTAVAITSDGGLIAAGSRTGTMTLLDVKGPAGGTVLPAQHVDTRIWSLEFSQDDRLLLSAAHDETAVLWDVATRAVIPPILNEHTAWVRCARFSDDDKLIATGSADNTVIIWSAETHQRCGPRLTNHRRAVTSLGFSPDQQIIASTSDDDQIVVWDVQQKQQLAQFRGYTTTLRDLRFRPEAGTAVLVWASAEGQTLTWDLTPASLKERCRRRANRNLTRAEWDFYIKEQPYRRTWPDLPEPVGQF